MLRPLAVLLLICLAACAPRARAPEVGHFRVTQTRFGDTSPTDWQGSPPSAHPVHGIDISVWQGDIDWPRARANGVNFVFIKATEGGDHADPAFAANWRNTAAAGVPRGAYHFYYHCRAASEQARWFIAHVPRQKGALPPVLDMEWTPRSPTCPDKRPGAEIRRDVRSYVSIVAAHYGQRPILYTTVDFYAENQLWQVSGVDFWLRSVATHPSDTFPGQPWLIWQYSGTGTVPGIRGTVDLNAFHGSAAAFRAWLAAQG